MKAAVFHEFGPPDVLKYQDMPDPEPRLGEVRIKVHGATVNRVLDVALRSGTQAHRQAQLPCIPGVDCAGVIDKIGPGVSKWKIGDHVAAAGGMPLDIVTEDGMGEDGKPYAGPMGMMGIRRPGGFADLVCVPSSQAVALPENLDFHEAAVVMRHCPTAWNLLMNEAKIKPGEWVLIMGASGNLGSVGIQIAKNIVGCKVITCAGSRERAELGLKLGADVAIDYSSQDLTAEILKATDGKGVDVLYDNIANPDILPKAFMGLGLDGRMVTAGAHGGPVVPINFFHLYDRRITIRGMPGAKAEDLPKCFAAAAEGKIKVQIAHVLPLSQAAEAHRMMETDPGMGKIVLDPAMG